MTAVKMPAKARLINLLLKERTNITLRRYILRARTETATHRAETWDEIAHNIWNLTGEPLVRETVINYARTFGIEPTRPMTQSEADDAVRAEPDGELAEKQATV